MSPTPATESSRTSQPARGSRVGDLRIHRRRPERPSILDRIAARLRGVVLR